MSGAKIRQRRRMVAALGAKLDCAERALAEADRALADENRELSAIRADIDAAPRAGADDPAFAAFVDRRRALIRERIGALQSKIAFLTNMREERRREVEILLRQTIAVEAAAEALTIERKRKLARRA